ncbi:MAG: hypothetical protein AAF993_19550 [Pseudomonadota bacterium]
MSVIMNPSQIKRREYAGLGALLSGVVILLSGLLCLLISLPISLLLMGLGAALGIAGLTILHNIPDVIGQPEELW